MTPNFTELSVSFPVDSGSGAMYVFLILSRDKFKNTHLAPLRRVHWKLRIEHKQLNLDWIYKEMKPI